MKDVFITYDPQVSAAYVDLNPGQAREVGRTEAVMESVIIDYAEDGTVLGIELLDIAKPKVVTFGEEL